MDAYITSYYEIERGQRELQQTMSRPARFRYVVNITGNGEARLTGTKAISFKTALLEEPSFTYGMQAVTPMRVGSLPVGTAMVLSYVTKGKFWRGVEMGFRVDSYTMAPQFKFWLVFEAYALRSDAALRSR